jgi:arsenic resistance protein ArsH
MNVYRSFQRTAFRSSIALSARQLSSRRMASVTNGDLNNTAAERVRADLTIDPAYRSLSFAIPSAQDEPSVRDAYRPFLLSHEETDQDWVAQLELSTVLKMVDLQVLQSGDDRLKVLVLHGSMRKRYDVQECVYKVSS